LENRLRDFIRCNNENKDGHEIKMELRMNENETSNGAWGYGKLKYSSGLEATMFGNCNVSWAGSKGPNQSCVGRRGE
jgi:hypothetical protein